MMKALVLGDVHADISHIKFAQRKAKENHCEYIIQLGDFGYFPQTDWGQAFLKECSSLCIAGVPIFFIDGNHDDHWSLSQEGGIFKVREGIYHLQRGYSWLLGRRKCLALGGAYSIDRNSRVLGVSYWEEETIKYRDLELASRAEEVDFLFTHDCPLESPLEDYIPLFDCNHTISNRRCLDIAVSNANPRMVIHGHYHLRYSLEVPTQNGRSRSYTGLDCNKNRNSSWLVIEG